MSSRIHDSDPSDARPALLLDAARRAAAYAASVRDRGVFPSEEALRGLDRIPRALTDTGLGAREVVAMLDRLGSPATVATTGGRYFGFVTGGAEPAATAAAVLLAAWDQNATVPVMSPVAALLDELAAEWCLELLGLPGSAAAAFCSGATVANLTCLVAARDALLRRAGWDLERRGLAGAPPLRVVASAQRHASVAKALRVAGIGTDQVEAAPTDERGRVVPDRFPDVDGLTLVLLQAGDVNTGYSDPFAELVPAARAAGGWVHVDGAFGLWAGASPSRRHLVEGVELADSWATDAHKWLNVSYDSGIAVCRDPEDLRRAMDFSAPYLAGGFEREPGRLGIQMSQRARGAEVWAVLASLGRDGVADLVDRCCEHAERMAALLAAGGAQVLVPPVLNQVLVHFDDDATTDAVVAAVQADRTCWAGSTVWRGRRAMRISVSDTATTAEDVAASAEAVLRCRRSLGRG